MSEAVTVPAILSVRPHQLGGLDVNALYTCGHEQKCWFPHAPKRASRQEIKGYVFGSLAHPEDALCSRCAREFREAQA